MDDALMNRYEKQLYTVFKTFDVDNEEALDREAVLQLCDALQLEARGAALVDSLFERRTDRVTFATFRNGLLSVLGASGGAPDPAPAPEPPPAHSDDDSSGREVAPKFVFGSKKYGRRSRPSRGGDEAGAPRAASASRVDTSPGHPRARYRRSSSAMESRACDALDHDRRIDRAQAVALCRDLRMDGIDPSLVERIFEGEAADETTVGVFFDRLNAALTSLATTSDADLAPAAPAPPDDDEDESVSGEAVADAWERAGVRRPRRLLAELGFTAPTLRPAELDRALDEELRALGTPPDERLDARPLLQLAALALGRLRLARTRARAAAAAAERDKLRADLAEANRRAQLLAQDVDENHARLEAERQASLRQLEARHAEAARLAAAESAAERERAAAARAALEAEAARRADVEARLRTELAALETRAEALERRASEAEERAAVAERERARAEDEARAAAARHEREAAREREAADAVAERLREAREEGARLRDRADELQAALEARAAGGRASQPRAADTSWRDETEPELETDAPPVISRIEVCDSPLPSIEQPIASPTHEHLAPDRRDRDVQTDPADMKTDPVDTQTFQVDTQTDPSEAQAQTEGEALRSRLEELQRQHEAEKTDLNDTILTLETALEEMRVEGERAEEYWAGKLRDERASLEREAAAQDARLADLLRLLDDYERQYRLPALLESALEPQYTQLAQVQLRSERASLEREAAAQDARLADLLRLLDDYERQYRLPALLESALEPQYTQLAQVQLRSERASLEREAAAQDARLADLLRLLDDYERQYRLPALLESALEPQYTQLAQVQLRSERASLEREAAAQDARLADLLRLLDDYERQYRLPALLESALEPQYTQLAQVQLRSERASLEREAAAQDARLADLLRLLDDYERQYRLPALLESALEPQYTQLAQEFEDFKAEAARELTAVREEGARELAAAREQAAHELAAAREQADALAQTACTCQQAATVSSHRAASDGAAHGLGEGEVPDARRSASAGALQAAPRARRADTKVVGCDGSCTSELRAQWARAAAAGAAEAAALRARAAHAERAAARLLARLHAADALVAELYRENCQLQHPLPRAPRLL